MKINSNDCIGCGQCFEACPYDAIKMLKTSGYARAEIKPDICMSCGSCQKICPGECINEN